MAFMFASTNLVVELGVVLWLLIGWQFALAEFVGGAVMITILALVLPRAVSVRLLDQARGRLDAAQRSPGYEPGADGGATEAAPALAGWRGRAGWSDAAGYAISDLTMLRTELLIGFLVAGFAAIAVPVRWWQALFLTGHSGLSTVDNVIVGPVLAFISFVCSVGNVPLAAALWKGGISFGGVVAFIFADLLALPMVLIYRKFYGTALAVRLSLVFWAVMSLAGLITELLFRVLSLIPAHRSSQIAGVRPGANYTTVLNAVALLAFGYLYWLYRNRDRFGGGAGLTKDVVCGMQVRTDDAPARTRLGAEVYYFCSDRCRERFSSDPGAFTAKQPVAAGGPGNAESEASPDSEPTDGTAVDPVCGMSVPCGSSALHSDHGGKRYHFCSLGCRDSFAAHPADYAARTAAGSGR